MPSGKNRRNRNQPQRTSVAQTEVSQMAAIPSHVTASDEPPPLSPEPDAIKTEAVKALREDMTETLKLHYETSRHQQDIRDRWQRFYTLTVGAIASVTGAFITGILTARELRLPASVREENVLSIVISPIFIAACWLVLVCGVFSLGIYLSQIVSYFVNYYVIARVLRSFAEIHIRTLADNQLINPFVFTYAFVEEVPRLSFRRFIVRYWFLSPSSYAADFWSNMFTLSVNSACLAVIIAKSRNLTEYPWIVNSSVAWWFASALIVQLLVRQIVLPAMMYFSLRTIDREIKLAFVRPSA